MGSKLNFTKILIGIIFCGVALIGFKPFPFRRTGNVNKAAHDLLNSERLDKAAAESLIANYKTSGAALKTVDNNGNETALEKFSFNTRDIRKILSRIDVSDGTPDKVAFKFGLNRKYRKRWHLIAYGIKDDNLLDSDDETAGDPAIFFNADFSGSGQNTRIKKNEAEGLRSLYENSALLNTLDKSENQILLYGFSFDADQINEIINSNASGEKSPDRLVIYLGLEDVMGTNRWHVIAYGMKNNRLLDYANAIPVRGHGGNIEPDGTGNASIFDKADPCPPCK